MMNERRTTVDRRALARIGIPILAFVTALWWSFSANAIAPEHLCTAPGVTPGSFCTGVPTTPWVIDAKTLGYGRYLTPGTYASLDEAIAAIQGYWLSDPGAGWCAMPLDHVDYDHVPGPWIWTSSPSYSAGIATVRQHRINFNVSLRSYETPPCAQSMVYAPIVRDGRELKCPTNYVLIYQAGPPVIGPYCALEWTRVDEDKSVGRCSSGQLKKGNPCEIGSGNKYQVESDYSGTGSFPLKFNRHYNSLPAKNYPTSPTIRWEPLGIGWSADYLQKIEYVTAGGVTTAFVHRPDGRRIPVNASGTTFSAPPDTNFNLTAQLNGSGVITGWTLLTEDDTTESYDAAGKLLSITNRGGIGHAVQYDSRGLISSVADTFGRQLQFTFDADRRLVQIIDPAGQSITYSYSTTRNLLSTTYADGRVRQYHYEIGYNYLTGITDEKGQRHSTYTYNNYNGLIASSELAGGVNKYQIGYYGDGSRLVTDPLNKQRTYGFTVKHGIPRLTSSTAVCQDCDEAKLVSYDANANISVRKDFNNVETHYGYDLTRNVEATRTEAFGTPRARTITTQWHPTFRLPTQIDEPGKRTTFTHDANGDVLTKTILDTSTSESRTWTYTYNSFGQVLTADGPRTDVSDVTTYAYYSCTTGFQCGQVETITNALGHVTTYNTYNAHGQPLTITDPNGVVTTLTYDLRQRLTSRTVGSEQTTFEYWPTGLLKKAMLPDASFLVYAYDAAHRLIEINDAEGNRIAYTLDAMGNRTAEQVYDPSNALSQTRTRVFNTLNQLWKDIGAAGTANVTTAFSYDNNGNQTGITAPLGRNTTQAYDELNRLKQVTDPLSGITQYGYNALDQLISVTDPRSKLTSYSYNALGDLKQQVSPDTGTTVNTYDAGGNLQTSTDARAKTATYGYDALNRLTSLFYPDQTISYNYDAGSNQKGRLTQLTDASGSTGWSYDAQGRVLSRQQSMGISKSLGYAYDADGRLQTLTFPSGNTVTYGYTSGKVTSLTLNGSTTILSNVLYQPFGPSRGWTWGNSTLAVREYDSDGKLTDIDSAGLKTYSYDDAFRITSIADSATPALSQSYGYDLLDRLTSATGASLSQGWTYDANGNRLTQTGSQASTYTVSITNNRLSSITGGLARTYSYDNSGNTTSDGATTLTYNDAGRMVSATKAGITTTYALNALGQWVKKTTGGASTYFVYDEAGRLVGEYDNAGALIQETIWFGDTPVATIRPNGSGINHFYIHTDHLNTPRRISQPSDNAVVWRWDSDPFGTSAANEDPDGDSNLFVYNLRFPGQYFDTETGLHYNYFRDYDSGTGRYVQSDPIGLDGGANTYGYADMNPVSNSDPSGLITLGPPGTLEEMTNAIGGVLAGRPKRVPGRVACHARCPTIPTKCPEPNCPVIYGYGVGVTVTEAKNASRADANAQSLPGCQLKHCTYKCTGPKGEPIYPSR